MTKEEIVNLMLDTVLNVNKVMAEQMGMSSDVIEVNLQQSRPSIQYTLAEVYEVLVKNGIIEE